MSKNYCVTVLFALIAVGLVNGRVQADSIPWGYSAGNTEIFNSNNSSKTSSITFSGASGIATGNSGVIIYNMTTTSSASGASLDSFSNVPFNLAFTLVDVKATGSKSATVKSTGVVSFSGLFSASNVTNQSLLPGATPWSSAITAQVILGANDVGWRTYSVELSSFTSPGQPGGSPGSIQAIVTISPADGLIGERPTLSAAPEPTSLVVAGLGIMPVVVFWRKRKAMIEKPNGGEGMS